MPSARKTSQSADADVFTAIAHPVRRRILELLADQEQNVLSLAQPFAAEISRSAISQHLKVLQDSGLVEVRKQGREHLYRLEVENLNEVYRWIKQYERLWTQKLDALGEFLENAAERDA